MSVALAGTDVAPRASAVAVTVAARAANRCAGMPKEELVVLNTCVEPPREKGAAGAPMGDIAR
ncbi:hypothetical protein GCM10010214_48060 [Streptomyces abikoensis]|nr:hypothetical protein GCM10010214_48060 [Streptomyces abikoensis]